MIARGWVAFWEWFGRWLDRATDVAARAGGALRWRRRNR